MDSHEEQTHHVKRVVPPSGKTIEVVYFKDEDGQTQRPPSLAFPSIRQPSCIRTCTCASSAPRIVLSHDLGRGRSDNWTVLLQLPELRRLPRGRALLRTTSRSSTRSSTAAATPGSRLPEAAPRQHGRGDRALHRRSYGGRDPARRLLSRPVSGVALHHPIGHQLERTVTLVGEVEARQVFLAPATSARARLRARPVLPWPLSGGTPPPPPAR